MFQKGQSGNPSGRPKEHDEVKTLARIFTGEAIERLAFWVRSDNGKASVAAASILLDRGWGKAAQFLEVKKSNPFDEFTATELRHLASALLNGVADGNHAATPDAQAGRVPTLQ